MVWKLAILQPYQILRKEGSSVHTYNPKSYPLITGPRISCANWQIEAALRMMRNNLVQGAVPAELIVYGGRGKLARNWEAFHSIERCLRSMGPNQTLLIQSGKPVGVLETFEYSPRVLIVNSMLVPLWSTDEEFWRLEARGLTMYGQMTAGSWAFIGQQGIMQGTYETLLAAGASPGKFVMSAGLGNMGGAQAPAAKMCGAAIIVAEMDPTRIDRCITEGWIDTAYHDMDAAVRRVRQATAVGEAVAIAFNGNAIDALEWLVSNHVVPDILTDQTAAHDPLRGYFPSGISMEAALVAREEQPGSYIELCKQSMRRHVELLLELKEMGATAFDYGNGIRFHALDQGLDRAFDIEGFVPLYVRPLFCEGRGPFRVAALSGNPRDIEVIDTILLDLCRENAGLCRWIRSAQQLIDFNRQPGLPARVCWLGMGERAMAVELIWEALKANKISAPVWVGRDHLDCGSVASPGRETEGMLDGSDAIADWPILNALTAVASGATWVSVHNGGGVGIGKAIHAGQCFVVTPDDECLERARRVFTNDPAIGVLRHADAGYQAAIETAEKHGLIVPMHAK